MNKDVFPWDCSPHWRAAQVLDKDQARPCNDMSLYFSAKMRECNQSPLAALSREADHAHP